MIKSVNKVSFIQECIYKVNSVLSVNQQKHSSNFVNGIIVDPKASILRISKLFGEKNHSSMNRFFTKNWWDEEKFNKNRIIEFINKEDVYVLVSDDTDNVKCGKKIKGVSSFKRHEGSGFEKAHCKVISGLVNQKGKFFPLFSTIYLKEEDAKSESVPFKTKHQIAKEHNILARKYHLNFYAHIYDSWYFCNDLIDHSKNRENIVSILSGRFSIVIDGEKMRSINLRRKIDKRKMRVMHSNKKRIRYIIFDAKLISGVPVKLVAFVDENDNEIKLLVSTNLNWSAKRIFQEYSKRHPIEVYIKDCKQELHMGSCSFRELKPQAKWDVLVMATYTILKSFLNAKEAIKQKIKTIGNTVDYIRENFPVRGLFKKCTT